MSTIKSSTTTTTAYQVVADTTGTLVFQTGATPTTALTIDASQAVTFAGAQTYTGSSTFTSGITVQGVTVGRGAGAVANNIALGASAMSGGSLSGARNIGIGTNAGNTLTTGAQNTFVGAFCGTGMVSGTQNIGIGDGAMTGNSAGATGSYNVGIGALTALTTGASNVGVGYQALNANTTASNNTAVGYQAMYTTTTGGNNTTIGYQSGYSIGTGTNNVCIGKADVSVQNVTNEITIATNSAAGKGANTGFISPNGGGVFQGNNGATWSVTSDQRLKKNIVDNNTGLNVINQIQVRNFEYRLPEEITELPQNQAIEKQGVKLGVIAQELQQILPECVKTESTGVMSVDTDNLTWYLVNAIKELKAEIDALKGA